jgi:undecaprenyl-diphosphatase
MWEIIVILSMIQGITEFLPISSSAHLILFPEFFNDITTNRGFDVALHFGTLLAVIIYLKKDILKIFLETTSPDRDNYRGFIDFKNLIISTVPIVIIGFLVNFFDINIIRNLEIIGWSTLVFGILLGLADKNLRVRKLIDNLNLKDALILGLAQTLAIIPGTSRSGIVITAGLLSGFSRYDASKYSLLLSIPVIIAATTLETISLYNESGVFVTKQMLLGILISFVTAYLTINFFMKWISRASLKIFVFYRIILGIAILLYAYF